MYLHAALFDSPNHLTGKKVRTAADFIRCILEYTINVKIPFSSHAQKVTLYEIGDNMYWIMTWYWIKIPTSVGLVGSTISKFHKMLIKYLFGYYFSWPISSVH